jgi:hypothetical protein
MDPIHYAATFRSLQEANSQSTQWPSGNVRTPVGTKIAFTKAVELSGSTNFSETYEYTISVEHIYVCVPKDIHSLLYSLHGKYLSFSFWILHFIHTSITILYRNHCWIGPQLFGLIFNSVYSIGGWLLGCYPVMRGASHVRFSVAVTPETGMVLNTNCLSSFQTW